MFWRKTKAAIATLHPLHQQIIWERRLSATLPPAEWDRLLASLASHDRLVKRRKWSVPPRLPAVVVPLLRMLAEDVPPGGTIGLSLDLRGPEAPDKRGPQRDLPVRRPVRSMVEWYSFDPWLAVRAELRDGSVLDLSVADRHRYRKVHKVNPRGKHKTKTKVKSRQLVRAGRTLAKGARLSRPASAPPSWLAVRVRDGARPIVRASARHGTVAQGPEQLDRVLAVLTEPFRWTPPATSRRRPA